ncbi:MAG TPA: nitrogenase component 1 [Treponemataceae bacterium]|nr:nitrogenase component 1 [Treponemataceae bacterium]
MMDELIPVATAAEPISKSFSSTRNACKLCAPLGACIAYRGIEGCIPLIHGSQGCATYIRRYGISHFREPIDIASSNFTESSAIFGGKENLVTAIANVARQYGPRAIGIATTCLTETIGDDVASYLKSIEAERAGRDGPVLFHAPTPSYRGTHMDGYHEAILSAVRKLAAGGRDDQCGDPRGESRSELPARVNLIPGFVSAEDLREFRDIMDSFGVPYTLLPDYSETLDGGSWETYQKLPEGGTRIADIAAMGTSRATLYLGKSASVERSAGAWLERNRGVRNVPLDLPIGIVATDAFFAALEEATGRATPERWAKARGRLVDAYIDGHKYCSGKKAVVYGEEDFAVAICGFLSEVGITPVIVGTGSKSAAFSSRVNAAASEARGRVEAIDEADFATILERARDAKPDLVIGNSKGYYLARNLGIPLVRCGFPVHDRMGGQRILHVGYRGTVALFDSVCNALMGERQQAAKNGWTYI